VDRRSATGDRLRHSFVIQPFGRVRVQVVVRIPIGGRVGQHDCRVPVLPERPVIGPCDARDPGWRRRCEKGQSSGRPERPRRGSQRTHRAEIRHHREKGAAVGQQEMEGKGVVLAAGYVVGNPSGPAWICSQELAQFSALCAPDAESTRGTFIAYCEMHSPRLHVYQILKCSSEETS